MEGAVAAGRVPARRDLAAVGVPQHDLDGRVGHRRVGRRRLITGAGDPLVEDRLAGPVDAAVGDEHDRPHLPRQVVGPDVRRAGRDPLLAAVDRGRGPEDEFTALRALDLEAAVGIGLLHRELGEHPAIGGLGPRTFVVGNPREDRHGGVGDRRSGRQVHDMPGQGRRGISIGAATAGALAGKTGGRERLPRLLRDDREPRHPDHRRGDDIVVRAEIGTVAGDDPVGAGLEGGGIDGCRHGDVVVASLEVRCRGEVGRVRADRRECEDRGAVGVIHPAGVRLAGSKSCLLVATGDAEMNTGEVPVVDADDREGRGPGAFGHERQRLRFDLGDEVRTEPAAGGVGVGGSGAGGDVAGIDESLGLLEPAGEVEARDRRDRAVAGLRDQTPQGGIDPCGHDVPGVGIAGIVPNRSLGRVARAADGDPGGPEEAVEIGVEKRGRIGVVAMKSEQIAVEHRRLEHGRPGVGERRIGLRTPGEKLLDGAEGRRCGVEFEGILRGHEAAVAGGCEGDGIADDDVPDGGAVGVGHRAGLDERCPVGDRQRLQFPLLRAPGRADGRREAFADVGHDRGEVPRGDAGEIRRIGAARGPLAKPPLVLQEEAPRPVRADRLEHAPGFRRCHLDRRSQPDEPLRIVAGPVAGFGEHAGGDRPRRLGPGPLGRGRRLDARECLERRLGAAFIEGPLHRAPQRCPRAGHAGIVTVVGGTGRGHRLAHREDEDRRGAEASAGAGHPHDVTLPGRQKSESMTGGEWWSAGELRSGKAARGGQPRRPPWSAPKRALYFCVGEWRRSATPTLESKC